MPTKCKEKRKQNDKNKYRRLRDRVLQALGGRCMNCGMEDNDVLQIDHIVPIKKPRGTRINNKLMCYRIMNGSYSRENLQILCANCHMKKTNEERREGYYNG